MAQRYKKVDYDRVIDVFREEFPPEVPWSPTVWKRELSVLKKALFNHGYTPDDVIDALHYCKLKGKRITSLRYIPHIIEYSKRYWKQIRQREAERQQMIEQVQDTPIEIKPTQQTKAPSWLGDAEFGEVE
jgi:hypothetical protein